MAKIESHPPLVGSGSGGGGGAAAAFTVIQTDTGTFPVATGPTDTLSLFGGNNASTGGSAATDTIRITVVPGGSNLSVQFGQSGLLNGTEYFVFDGNNLTIGGTGHLNLSNHNPYINFNRHPTLPPMPGLGRNALYFDNAGELASIDNGGATFVYLSSGSPIPVPGSDKDVLYNNSGVLGAASNFQVDNSDRKVTVFGGGGSDGYYLTDNSGTGHFKSNQNGNFELFGVSKLYCGTPASNLLFDQATQSINSGNGAADGDSTLNLYGWVGKPYITTIFGNSGRPESLLRFQANDGTQLGSFSGDGWLGLGIAPDPVQAVIDVKANAITISNPSDPLSVAFDFSASGYNAAGDGTTYDYLVYNYKSLGGGTVYSVSNIEASVTEAFTPSSLTAAYVDSGMPYDGSFGYLGDGTDFQYGVAAVYSGKRSAPVYFDVGPIPNDGNAYSVNVDWTASGLAPDSYLLVQSTAGPPDISSSVAVTVVTNSYVDDTAGAYAANPGYATPISFNINLSWPISSGIDGYRVLNTLNSTYADQTDPSTPSLIDSNAWSVGSVITPNSFTPPALRASGEVDISIGPTVITGGTSSVPTVSITQSDTNGVGLTVKTTNGDAIDVIDGSNAIVIQAKPNGGLRVRGASAGGRVGAGVGTTSTGTGTTEQDLKTLTIPASQVGTSGDGLAFDMAGTFAANSNTKRVRVYLGATNVLFDTGALAFNGSSWQVRGQILRVASTSWSGYCVWSSSDVLLMSSVNTFTGSADLATSLTLKATGTDGTSSAGDISQTWISAEYTSKR